MDSSMKTKEEIKEIAEKKYPYNPYDNQFFPEKRISLINGFIDGYLEAQKSFKTPDSEEEK
jgi:hypothetical protein